MRLAHYYKPRANAVKSGPVKTDGRIGMRSGGKASDHQANALTLLSAGEASTGELAAVLELSSPYLATLLERLELEGRVESGKDGRRKIWRLP